MSAIFGPTGGGNVSSDVSLPADEIVIGAGDKNLTSSGLNIDLVEEATVFFDPDPTNVNLGNYRVRQVGGTGSHRFTIAFPDDFASLVSIYFIMSPASGAATSGRDIDIYTEYAANNELIDQHQESDTTSLYDFTGLTNTFTTLDVTSLFSQLAPGDVCGGIFVDHNALGGAINYFRIVLKYLRG